MATALWGHWLQNLILIEAVTLSKLKPYLESQATLDWLTTRTYSKTFMGNIDQNKSQPINTNNRLRALQGNNTTGIFSSTFLLPVNESKNSILNWVFKLNLFFIRFSKTWVIKIHEKWNYNANYSICL